jgi:hypothetical protein
MSKAIVGLVVLGAGAAALVMASRASAGSANNTLGLPTGSLPDNAIGEPFPNTVQVDSSQGPVTLDTFTFPPDEFDNQYIIVVVNQDNWLTYTNNRSSGARVPVAISGDDFTKQFLTDAFLGG